MEGDLTDIARYKRLVTQFLDLTQDARNRSTNDIRYYHSKQYSSDELQALRDRKQPDSIFNHIKSGVNGTLGVLKQGETDPKAWPRTPNDEQSADVATKTLRYIADYNSFDDMRLDVAFDYLVPGTGAVIVEVDERKRVTVEKIRWEELIYDPRSRRADFKDASYMGIAKWMFADDVKTLYPDMGKDIDNAMEGDSPFVVDQMMEDRPLDGKSGWVDKRQRRLMVVDLYERRADGWHRCVFFAGGKLESGPSAYLDEDKKPSCPIEAQSCFVDDENVRYGIVYDMRGPQDEINKRRSKLLHLLNNRQVMVTHPEFVETNADIARDEAARPDGALPAGWGPVPLTDLTAGQFALLAEAKSEIERFGPNPAVLGRMEGSQSGRAHLVRQQAGLTEQAIIFAGVEAWELRVYRQMWLRARQFMTGPDYVRITDDEGAPQFIGINQPIKGPPQVVMGENGLPTIQPTILGYENALGEMDVDITLDTVPDVANLQQEQFQILAELAKMYGPQEVPFDDMLMLSQIPDKAMIVERRKKRAEEAQQNPMQELQQRGAVAEVAKTEAEAIKTQAEADLIARNADKAEVETVRTQVETRNAMIAPQMDAFKIGAQIGDKSNDRASKAASKAGGARG